MKKIEVHAGTLFAIIAQLEVVSEFFQVIVHCVSDAMLKNELEFLDEAGMMLENSQRLLRTLVDQLADQSIKEF